MIGKINYEIDRKDWLEPCDPRIVQMTGWSNLCFNGLQFLFLFFKVFCVLETGLSAGLRFRFLKPWSLERAVIAP